jgi:hypothetical protein
LARPASRWSPRPGRRQTSHSKRFPSSRMRARTPRYRANRSQRG